MSTTQLKDTFTNMFNQDVTIHQIKRLMDTIAMFELRDENPQALNSPSLGVHLAKFFPKDQDDIFAIFNMDRDTFDMAMSKCPVVRREHIVVSDPFNLFCTWACHLIAVSKLPQRLKDDGMIAVLKMLHYKFFSSLILHNFPHRANEEIMNATIDGLSLKFDIKNPKTPTWRTLIESKCQEFIDRRSIHYKTFNEYKPDAKILYVVSDIQTRIRIKIRLITSEYYKTKDRKERIGSYTSDQLELDQASGKNIEMVYERMAGALTTQVLNTNSFINYADISLVSRLCGQLRSDMMSQLLTEFSRLATEQYQTQQHNQITKGKNNLVLYTGYKIFLDKLIQTSYRSAVLNKVNLRSKLAILEHVRNIYRSSRLIDKEIINVKASADHFVRNWSPSIREIVLINLRLGLVLYLLIQSMKVI